MANTEVSSPISISIFKSKEDYGDWLRCLLRTLPPQTAYESQDNALLHNTCNQQTLRGTSLNFYFKSSVIKSAFFYICCAMTTGNQHVLEINLQLKWAFQADPELSPKIPKEKVNKKRGFCCCTQGIASRSDLRTWQQCISCIEFLQIMFHYSLNLEPNAFWATTGYRNHF